MSISVFTTSHTFPCTRERLYAVWTEPPHIAASSAPPGGSFASPVFELRVGGRHHYCARTADGHETWGLRVFTAIEPGCRLQWRQSFADASGAPARHPMAPAFPLTLASTLVLEDGDSPVSTRVTLPWEPVDAAEAEVAFFAAIHDGMRGGWDATFRQIEAYVAGLQPV